MWRGMAFAALRGMDDAKQRLLKHAINLLGQHGLARRLNVPSSLLDDWIRGDATMPDGKLLVLAAILETFSSPQRGHQGQS